MNRDRQRFDQLVAGARPVRREHLEDAHRAAAARSAQGPMPLKALAGLALVMIALAVVMFTALERREDAMRVAAVPTPTAAPSATSAAVASPTDTPEPAPVAPQPTTSATEVPPPRPAATATPTVAPAPRPTLQPLPPAADCPAPTKQQLGDQSPSSRSKISFDQMARVADTILVATVERIGTPRWNSESGCWERWNDAGMMLYKPVTLRVETVVADKASVPADVRYGVYDERLGYIGMAGSDNPPKLAPGQKYLFFAVRTLNKQTQFTNRLMILAQAYPVDSQGRVVVAPGDAGPLEQALSEIRKLAYTLAVEVDCYRQPVKVKLTNHTDTGIIVRSIGASHYNETRKQVESHDVVEMSRVIQPGGELKYDMPEGSVDTGASNGKAYESVRVVTSFGSAAVPCDYQAAQIREGEDQAQLETVQLGFRLKVNGQVAQSEGFEVAVSEQGSDTGVVLAFCGGTSTKGQGRPACQSGQTYTGYVQGSSGPPTLTFVKGTVVRYRIAKTDDRGGMQALRSGVVRLDQDTTISAEPPNTSRADVAPTAFALTLYGDVPPTDGFSITYSIADAEDPVTEVELCGPKLAAPCVGGEGSGYEVTLPLGSRWAYEVYYLRRSEGKREPDVFLTPTLPQHGGGTAEGNYNYATGRGGAGSKPANEYGQQPGTVVAIFNLTLNGQAPTNAAFALRAAVAGPDGQDLGSGSGFFCITTGLDPTPKCEGGGTVFALDTSQFLLWGKLSEGIPPGSTVRYEVFRFTDWESGKRVVMRAGSVKLDRNTTTDLEYTYP